MTINEFIKSMQREFGDIAYRATRFEDGKVIEKNYPKWDKPQPIPKEEE
jgi:hypothetical protein